jgi:mRNA interferase HigB
MKAVKQLLCFQNENYLISLLMNIINRKTIIYYTEKYPKAKNQLLTWYNEILKQEFDNFNELKAMYGNASIVNDQRVVFNIKGNEYRLVVSINFRRRACYTIWFGTHKEYDKIDVATVKYNLNV